MKRDKQDFDSIWDAARRSAASSIPDWSTLGSTHYTTYRSMKLPIGLLSSSKDFYNLYKLKLCLKRTRKCTALVGWLKWTELKKKRVKEKKEKKKVGDVVVLLVIRLSLPQLPPLRHKQDQ